MVEGRGQGDEEGSLKVKWKREKGTGEGKDGRENNEKPDREIRPSKGHLSLSL